MIATRKVKQESGKVFLESARKAGRDALLAGAPLVQLPSRFSCFFFSRGCLYSIHHPPPPHHLKVDHINSNQDSTGHANKFIHIRSTIIAFCNQTYKLSISSPTSLYGSLLAYPSPFHWHLRFIFLLSQSALFNLHILFLYFNNLFCAI